MPCPVRLKSLYAMTNRLSLRTGLVLAFVAQLIGAMVLLGYLNWQAGTLQATAISIVALAISVFLGLMIVGWILTPIRQLKAAAQDMAQGNWQVPLRINRSDELGELAQAFNLMAAQLQQSFAEMQALNLALTASEQRWRQVLDGLPLGIVVINRQGDLVFGNEMVLQLLAISAPTATAPLPLTQVLQAVQAGSQTPYPLETLPLMQSLKGQATQADDLELHQFGRIIPLEMTSTPIFDQAGQVEFAIAAIQDITARKQAQQVLTDYSQRLEREVAERTAALQQIEATQRAMLTAIPDLLIRYSGDGIYLDIMSSGEVPLLISQESSVGRHVTDVLPAAMAAERLHYIRQALATGTPQVYEYSFRRDQELRYEEARVIVSAEQEVLVMVRDITERKQAENSLRESQLLYRSLTEVLPHGLYRIDPEGRITFANPAFLTILNRSLETCLGAFIYDFYPPQLVQQNRQDDQQVMATGEIIKQTETCPDPDQPEQVSYRQIIKSPIYDANGAIVGMQGVFWDVTDLKRTEAALAHQRQFLQSVIDNIPSAIVVKDQEGRIRTANQASAAMHGITLADMVGQFETDFNTHITEGDQTDDQAFDQQVMQSRVPYQTEQKIIDVNGISRWYQVLVNPFQTADDRVEGVIRNYIDITERRQTEIALTSANEQLEQLATQDGLTRIANRRRFDDYLQQEWQRMVREQQPLSLILFDVDFFKAYNDYYGHQQGDEALTAIARAAHQSVKRAADLIARYGGEEFAVVLPNTRRVGAEIVAQAIQSQIADLRLSHKLSKVNDYLTVSMGLASVVPQPGQTPDQLVAAADAALYQAKRRGRNRYWIRLL